MPIDLRLRRAALPLLCLLLAACGGDADPARAAGEERARALLALLPPAPDSAGLPTGIAADLARIWGEDWKDKGSVRATRAELDGDGRGDYLLVGFCGSSGACAGYAYRDAGDGRFARLAQCTTGEEGLTAAATTTGGLRDLAIPFGDTVVLRFDGRQYAESGGPSRCVVIDG